MDGAGRCSRCGRFHHYRNLSIFVVVDGNTIRIGAIVCWKGRMMAVAEIIWGASLFFGSGGAYTLSYLLEKRIRSSIIPPSGRTQQEWYETIKALGKEQYEELSRGPLDGVEENAEYGWKSKELMGDELYAELMKEWYPEKTVPDNVKHDRIYSVKKVS